jgi:transcriptional regulator of acetoin/glycerol metabolism
MDCEKMKSIWQRFMTDGALDATGMQPIVVKSWQKCRSLGVNPYSSGGTPVDKDVFHQVLDRSNTLLQVARPVMQSVYRIIQATHFLLALTDGDGIVLDTIGDEAILQRSENILFRRGSIWSNAGVGSNAPGIALEYDVPIQMNGAEHYCQSQHSWTCSAAPIHDTNGKIIGCLDVSGPVEAAHPHTLALVISSAFSIERMLKDYHRMALMQSRVSGNQAIYTFDDIMAADPVMKQAVARARQYAAYDGSVLIEGESGTGKELFAQAIHTGSSRAKGPFVAVNCASLPRDLIESELFGYEKGAFTGALKNGNPGKFELADHGTLFLDEIGEMPMEFQAKLLRAVENLRIRRIGGRDEKKLDVRVIAATNRDLEKQVRSGAFRGDLYYRLNVLQLHIPPLRKRPDDIAFCAKLFLNRFNQRYADRRKSFTEAALQSLQCYSWPGNVRELQNVVERAFYTSEGTTIGPSDFPVVQEAAADAGTSVNSVSMQELDDAGKNHCLAVLQAARGNVLQAAKSIGVSQATFYRLCKTYGITPKLIRRQCL